MNRVAVREQFFEGSACLVSLVLGLLTLASRHVAPVGLMFCLDFLFLGWMARRHHRWDVALLAGIFFPGAVASLLLQRPGFWIWLAGQWMSGPGYKVHVL